jgi:hypothetical protein
MSEENVGAVSGAMQGFAVAGPVGAFVGAALGFASGNKAKKARLANARAARIAHEMSLKQAAIQRRDLMRDFRINRAQQIAAAFTESGGITSSTVATATGSLMSQYTTNMGILDWTGGANKEFAKQRQKAGNYAGQSAMIATGMKALLSVGSAAYGNYQAGKAQGEQLMSNMSTFGNDRVPNGASNMPQYGAYDSYGNQG